MQHLLSSVFAALITCCKFCIGGRNRVAVECPHPNKEDVGSNLTATRNAKMDIGMAPCTEGALIVQTGSKWKTSDVKAELDL